MAHPHAMRRCWGAPSGVFGRQAGPGSVGMVRCAKAMVCERFYDAAITNSSVTAFVDRADEFKFQGFRSGDAALDLGKMVSGNAVRLMAGSLRRRRKSEQLAYVFYLEAKFA